MGIWNKGVNSGLAPRLPQAIPMLSKNPQELWITLCTKWGQLIQAANTAGFSRHETLLSNISCIKNQ
jgi:hypothetical protein